jgi:hypothetical protein
MPELNLGQMVREVERAAAGKAKTFLVPTPAAPCTSRKKFSRPSRRWCDEFTLFHNSPGNPVEPISAHRPHAAHLVSGMRHRHHGELLQPGPDRIQDRLAKLASSPASAAPAALPDT